MDFSASVKGDKSRAYRLRKILKRNRKQKDKALTLLEEVASNDVVSFDLAERIEDFLRETGRW